MHRTISSAVLPVDNCAWQILHHAQQSQSMHAWLSSCATTAQEDGCYALAGVGLAASLRMVLGAGRTLFMIPTCVNMEAALPSMAETMTVFCCLQ